MGIDMWACGVTVAELFSGRMLIQPASRGGLAMQMAQLMGRPPPGLFDSSKYGNELLALVARTPNMFGPQQMRQRLSTALGASASQDEQLCMDFLSQVLRYAPHARLKPHEALAHPFLAS